MNIFTLQEQALRGPVIFRKICFGNRSPEGAESTGINLSLIKTAQCQNKDPLPFLQTLLTQGSHQAKHLLYAKPQPP